MTTKNIMWKAYWLTNCARTFSTLLDFKKVVSLTTAMVEETYKPGFRRQISLVESFSGIY